MPNWNSNTIHIEGPADKIRELWARAQSQEGLLEAMIPIGEWDYDCAVSTWGTKWDISLEGLQLTETDQGRAEISGYADSAWSPPIEAFQAYANDNLDVYLEIKYFEPGMSFIGVWDSEGGDACWEDVGGLILQEAENEDDFLMDLFEHFNVWDWYEADPDDEENLEIDLDGGISAVNEN